MADNFKYSDITSEIIRSFYTVYNKLGYGFFEKVYENSMLIELRKIGFCCSSQLPVEVFNDKEKVGFYITDIVVANSVIVEIKAAQSLCDEHEAQLTNYLRASDIEVGYF